MEGKSDEAIKAAYNEAMELMQRNRVNLSALMAKLSRGGYPAGFSLVLCTKCEAKPGRILSGLRPTGSGRPSRSDALILHPRNVPVCIIAVDSMFHDESVNQNYTEGDELGKSISGAVGNLTKNLFDDFGFSLLISTGGDTSLGICQHLGISGIEPLKEICPGIPLVRIVGGAYNGRFMITKSGRFGEADTLLKILDCINE